MYFATLISIAVATAAATPLAKNGPQWEPVAGTAASCEPSNDKYISVSEANSLAEQACVAMMAPCAFPEHHKEEDLVCAQQWTWPLTSTENAGVKGTVLSDTGGVLSDVHPVLTVFPPGRQIPRGEDFWTSVGWSPEDCLGYFGQLLSQSEPSGCVTSKGAGAGDLTVGGTDALSGTVFKVSFADAS